MCRLSAWLTATFTLQLVCYSTLIKYYFAVIFDKKLIPIFQKVLQLLGDFVPQTPYRGFAPGPHGGTSVPLPSPRSPNLGPPATNFQRRPCLPHLQFYVILGVQFLTQTKANIDMECQTSTFTTIWL